MGQLALPLRLADHAVFTSYLDEGNEAIVATLSVIADRNDGGGCWLWGPKATGKTHLLQATCARADDRAVYLPLAQLTDASAHVLDGLENRELICLDDIDVIAGNPAWEHALFALCNQLFDAGHSLVVSATTSPRECPIDLPDLHSRLMRLPAFRLRSLSDAARVSALQLRARHRGLDLPTETARFLMHRSRRDMASLYEILDELDRAALRAQRRLTIPFVKDVLGDEL